MTDIEVLNPAELDYDRYAELENAVFADVLKRYKSEEVLNADLFRWKHDPPAGRGRIAVIRDGGAMVAVNAMFPLFIRHGGKRILGWQSCDTATLPQARGKGCFVRCLAALRATLGPDEFFFGFPNRNSTRGFGKAGCLEVREVATWVRVLPLGPRSERVDVTEIDDFDETHDVLNERLVEGGHAMLDKNAAYLRWRYRRHPNAVYTILVRRDAAGLHGTVVVRTALLAGRQCAVIMDLLADDGETEYALLRAACRYARVCRLRTVVLMRTAAATWALVRAGFVRVPGPLMPKRQVLMGVGAADIADLHGAGWRVQTGDWDAV